MVWLALGIGALFMGQIALILVIRAGRGAATVSEPSGNPRDAAVDEPLPAPGPSYLELLERLAIAEVHLRRIETQNAERSERTESRLAALNTRVQRLRQEFEGGSEDDAESDGMAQLAQQVVGQLSAPAVPHAPVPDAGHVPPPQGPRTLVPSTLQRYGNARHRS